jgi:putative flavoprotein involved in K+ transport
MVESIETVIIGAGHAGLSTSYYLSQLRNEHIVLEKASQPANAWRSERWDTFTFVTPNWTFQIPGGEYDGPNPDGFMTRAELVERFDRYVEKYQLPVRRNAGVTAVKQLDDGGFQVQTEDQEYRARNVVTANGWFNVPKLPSFASQIPASILQLHTNQYRNPQSLPDGAVLVVGSGQSGGQVAEELNQSGRKVFLAASGAPHIPRRYRGKDAFFWVLNSGFADRTLEQMNLMGKSFVAPMLSGKDGGHDINLHKFFRDGITLVGHVLNYEDGKLILAPDLKANLTKADMAQKFILKMFDDYIQRAGLDAPAEQLPEMNDAYRSQDVTELDLQAEGIHTIIWACGYRYDASIFQFPVLDRFGMPDAPTGISAAHPGLYFAGFPFLPTLKSGILAGVQPSVSVVANAIHGKKDVPQTSYRPSGSQIDPAASVL